MKRLTAIGLCFCIALAIMFLMGGKSISEQKISTETTYENFIRYHKIDDKIYAEYQIICKTENASSCRVEMREVVL